MYSRSNSERRSTSLRNGARSRTWPIIAVVNFGHEVQFGSVYCYNRGEGVLLLTHRTMDELDAGLAEILDSPGNGGAGIVQPGTIAVGDVVVVAGDTPSVHEPGST